MVKKILYMGYYLEDNSRSSLFIKGLHKQNVIVYEHNVQSKNIIKNIRLFLKNFKELKSQNFDLIIFFSEVPIQFILAKILAYIKRIPLIHDIYISKLQTIYDDYKLENQIKLPKIIWRIILYTLDLIECTFADNIILDTYSHIKFFHEKFKVPIKKFRRVFVGIQDDIIYPLEENKKKKNEFIVGFCGKYIPLQGVEYIIKAVKILEKDIHIKFILIGKGQTYERNRKLAHELKLKNIEFVDPVPLRKLSELISKFDVGLGIFGDSAKTMQVIPNKVSFGIAMKIPMISCDSPAINELFTNNENILLCERANPESLAEAILKLKNDANLREKIKENAYVIFHKYCSIDAIGRTLYRIISGIKKK